MSSVRVCARGNTSDILQTINKIFPRDPLFPRRRQTQVESEWLAMLQRVSMLLSSCVTHNWQIGNDSDRLAHSFPSLIRASPRFKDSSILSRQSALSFANRNFPDYNSNSRFHKYRLTLISIQFNLHLF